MLATTGTGTLIGFRNADDGDALCAERKCQACPLRGSVASFWFCACTFCLARFSWPRLAARANQLVTSAKCNPLLTLAYRTENTVRSARYPLIIMLCAAAARHTTYFRNSARKSLYPYRVFPLHPQPPHKRSPGTLSVVTYTPMTELDYGTLLCIATNRIGRQRVPCAFHVIAAGNY